MHWFQRSWQKVSTAILSAHWAPLCAILFGAFTLRIHLLGAQNLWWDEALAVWAVRKGLISMTLWTAGDVHPPLFFWLLYGMTRLAGQTEFAARFVSLACGLLTIPLAYQLGRKLVNHQVGLTAALLLAAARFHVWWSQEARMYILAGLGGAASLYFLVSWWRQEQQAEGEAWKMLGPYVLASVAALYTLYLSALVLLVENAFVLIASLGRSWPIRWRLWRRWIVAQGITLLAFLPWLALALPRMHTWSTATPFRFLSFLRLYGTALSLGISTYIERYTWLVLPFMVICLAGLALGLQQKSGEHTAFPAWQTALLLLLCLTLPPIAVYFLTMPRGLFYSPHIEARYLLPLALSFYLLLAWSLWLLWRRIRLIGLLSLLFVAATFGWSLPQHYQGRYLRDELQSLVRVIAAYAAEGDAVCVVSGSRYPVFDYYYNDPLRPGPRPPVYYLPTGVETFTADNVESQLAPLATSHPRLWLALVEAQMQDAEGRAKAWFDKGFRTLLGYRFRHNQLYLYAASAQPPQVAKANLSPDHRLGWDLSPLGTLLGYDLPAKEYRPDDTVHLALYWENPREARAVVELRDRRGNILESREVSLPSAAGVVVRQQFDFPIHSRTPPGRYHFRVKAADGGSAAAEREFGELIISGTLPLPKIGRIEHRLSMDLGHLALLEGYALRVQGQRGKVASLRPGDTLYLTLYWRGLRKIEERYTVFTHLVGQAYNPVTGGPVWAQHDGEPLEGGLPTTQWFVGQLLADEHRLKIDPKAPAGEYEIEVGLYNLPTQARLPVWDAAGRPAGDRIVLGRWRVEAGR